MMISEGRDYLAKENKEWLQSKEEVFQLPYLKDKSLVHRKLSLGSLNARRFGESLNYSLKAIKVNPLRLKNYLFPFYLTYLIFRRSINP